MSDATCMLFNIQRFSTEDGPGIRTTLFFKGCPLQCPWCHNPEGIQPTPQVVWQSTLCIGCGDCARACKNGAIHIAEGLVRIDPNLCKRCAACADACSAGAVEKIGTEYDSHSLLKEVLRDRTFYATSGGGITLSGGEPLVQHAFLREFILMCRREGLHIAVDTCGVVRPDWLEPLLCQVDLILFDLKLIDPTEHKRLTGAPLETVLATLDRIVAAGPPIWIRTPIIPGYTDDESNVRGIAKYLRTHVRTLQRYDLLAFSNLCTAKYEMLGRAFPLSDTPLLTRGTLERLVSIVREEGIDEVRWSGPTRADL